jgi:hypothetical protein
MGIERQRYHGGTLIGRDAFLLFRCACSVARALGRSTKALDFRRRWSRVMERLYSVLEIATLPRMLCLHELMLLWIRCASAGNIVPKLLPQWTPTLKYHVLIREVPLFALTHGSTGCASEQAVESLNRIVNRLDRTYVTIGNPEKRLAATLAQWCVESDVSVASIALRVRHCPICSKPIAKRHANHCTCAGKRRRPHLPKPHYVRPADREPAMTHVPPGPSLYAAAAATAPRARIVLSVCSLPP